MKFQDIWISGQASSKLTNKLSKRKVVYNVFNVFMNLFQYVVASLEGGKQVGVLRPVKPFRLNRCIRAIHILSLHNISSGRFHGELLKRCFCSDHFLKHWCIFLTISSIWLVYMCRCRLGVVFRGENLVRLHFNVRVDSYMNTKWIRVPGRNSCACMGEYLKAVTIES